VIRPRLFDASDRTGSKKHEANLAAKTSVAPGAFANNVLAPAPAAAKVQDAEKKIKPRLKKAKAEQPTREAWWTQARSEMAIDRCVTEVFHLTIWCLPFFTCRTAEEEDACLKLEYYRVSLWSLVF
jgi:hypothetical protein